MVSVGGKFGALAHLTESLRPAAINISSFQPFLFAVSSGITDEYL
jgi:hypothetical protein